MVSDDQHDWLAHCAQRTPDRAALSFEDERWTFAALHAASSGLTLELREAGLAAGDRVALFAANRPATVIALHAVPRLHATVVPLNLRLSDDELDYQLRLTEPRLLLSDDPNQATAERIAARTGTPLLVLPDSMEDVAVAEPVPIPAGHLHTIMFTSGTTGRPKGAMLTAANHQHSALASMERLGLAADDRWLCCVPLFHMAGLSIVIRGAIHGIPVLLHDRFDPEAANRAIDSDGVTIASLVPVMLQRMLDARDDRPYPAGFRCALTGGGPIPERLLERCLAAGVPLTPTYGLTETASQVVTAQPSQAARGHGLAGRPLPGSEIRIAQDGVEQPPGTVGEVQVRGPSVMAGYYQDPDATALAFDGDWLRSGDIGTMDGAGCLRVLDRRTDLIISGGENVYPAQVEAVLLAHPHVQEAGVVAVSDPEWGQRPLAFVVLADGARASSTELLAHCRARLAAFKVPTAVHIVDALPRTAAGKLQRHRLRERFANATEPAP